MRGMTDCFLGQGGQFPRGSGWLGWSTVYLGRLQVSSQAVDIQRCSTRMLPRLGVFKFSLCDSALLWDDHQK